MDLMNHLRNNLSLLEKTKMPFGKYRGVLLIDLPENYLVWFHSQGLPEGQLGQLLELIYEIKLNGLEHLLTPLRSSREG
jgi:uncharacterized protein (DUF3820 family)